MSVLFASPPARRVLAVEVLADASRASLTVTAQCKGCGACLLTCPTHAIRPDVGGTGGPLAVRADLCTGCGECIEICPADAIEDPRDKGDPRDDI